VVDARKRGGASMGRCWLKGWGGLERDGVVDRGGEAAGFASRDLVRQWHG